MNSSLRIFLIALILVASSALKLQVPANAQITNTNSALNLACVGNNGPVTYSASGLPSGFNVQGSSIVYSGSAPVSGVYNVTASVTDSSGNRDESSFLVIINVQGASSVSTSGSSGSGQTISINLGSTTTSTSTSTSTTTSTSTPSISNLISQYATPSTSNTATVPIKSYPSVAVPTGPAPGGKVPNPEIVGILTNQAGKTNGPTTKLTDYDVKIT
jgi:hypothetical protein